MKKVLTVAIFISMASIAIAQCPGSKAEEYKRKLQVHNSKSAREKAELPGMLGQAYSQAASYYMYKCMCENGYAKNEEGKKEIAAAANGSADYFNSANISGEPKLSKIDPSSCTLAGKGKAVSGNESANYVVPEKGLFFNNKMMSDLSSIATESDNEELKTIVKEMNEVHQNANYMRQNYGLDQEQTEMLNVWEDISQVATILVANSIKKDQEYFEKLERERKEMERLADNMSHGKARVISAGIEKVIDSLRIEYIYPFYLTKNDEYKQYLLKEFDRSITTYYPITDLYREMLQQYYVVLDLSNNYKVNMQRYPWETQKDQFLQEFGDNAKRTWTYEFGEDLILMDLLHTDTGTPAWDRNSLVDIHKHNKQLTDEERQFIMAQYKPEDYNIPYSQYGRRLKESSDMDSLLLYAFLNRKQARVEKNYLHPNENYEYMLPIWIANHYRRNTAMTDLIAKYQEVTLLELMRKYPPLANLAIKSFSDFADLTEAEISQFKKASVYVDLPGGNFKSKKHFSYSKQLLQLTRPMLTFANMKAGNLINMDEYQSAIDVITTAERQLITLYEVSDESKITDAFNNPYLSSDDKDVICFDYEFFHRHFQLQCFKLDAQTKLKQYEAAKKTVQEIEALQRINYATLSPSLIYFPFPRLFSFDNRAKFYPIYLSYLETGRVNKELFFNTFDDQLKILNLIEEWQVTHSDIEPILLFLN
ncbi:MAG: hypothetical protein R2820_14135 [Cyclobacteriaceae bacterium]